MPSDFRDQRDTLGGDKQSDAVFVHEAEQFGASAVHEGRHQANHGIMDIVASRNPSLPGFEKSHKALQIIIGAGEAIDIITSEKTPPETAKDFLNMRDDTLVDEIAGRADAYFQLQQIALYGLGNRRTGWRWLLLRIENPF